MRADSDDDAHVTYLLAPVANRVHGAVAKGDVGHFALAEHGQRLEGFCQRGRVIVITQDLHDEVHLAAFGDEADPILWQALKSNVIERVDAEARALMHHGAHPLRRVPIFHGAGEVVVVVGVSAEGVHTQNHAANLDIEELHFGDLHFRNRLGRWGVG